jgi:hypothetical protein
LADLNGDGHDDMISGSYWPGDISVFFGQGAGKFAGEEFLKDPDGKNANAGKPWAKESTPEMDSLAAAPWLVDWDADGDLDLLVGNIAGRVVLLDNVGGAKTPKFVRKGPIQAGGSDLCVDQNDAGPTVADWDGDGTWDLVVGGGGGTIMFFRNEGQKGAPKLAPGEVLVKGKGHGTGKHGDEPQGPGSRLKPHVCDWNGDGALDLLVGDYASMRGPEPKLTAAQRKTREKLQRELQEVSETMGRLYEKCDNDPAALAGKDKKAFDEAQKRHQEVWEALRPLQAEHRSSGFVWVYLRKPGKAGRGG